MDDQILIELIRRYGREMDMAGRLTAGWAGEAAHATREKAAELLTQIEQLLAAR